LEFEPALLRDNSQTACQEVIELIASMDRDIFQMQAVAQAAQIGRDGFARPRGIEGCFSRFDHRALFTTRRFAFHPAADTQAFKSRPFLKLAPSGG
jgi:hypothetical protein